MQSFYDYKKYAILYVDDEERSLKMLRNAFSDEFRIFTANNAAEGFRVFEELGDNLAILISDQRMPGEKGVQLLERARQTRPRVIRILATAFADYEAAVQAVNSGAIYKYVHKPWDPAELQHTLRRGLEFFIVQNERDQLLREKMTVLHNMMITDRVVSLGILASGLSHHVRNSLVAIRTFLDLAPGKLSEEGMNLEALRNPKYWNEFYDHVQSQVRRITELLTDLGAASDGEPTFFADEVSLHQVLATAISEFDSEIEKKKLVMENKVPTNLPKLKVDLSKFKRLFNLLLLDELTNLNEGAKVEMNASFIPSETGTGEIELVIKDNGPGLPEENLRSIFDPFFLRTENPHEFGLNLMAAYFIVYHHGGKIRVTSSKDLGTTFIFNFPLTPPTQKTLGNQDQEFISKVLLNDQLWEKLLTSA